MFPRFKRLPGKRAYRKMFVIAVEGKKTEQDYFHILNSQNSVIHIHCIKSSNQSSPSHVLKRMDNYLKQQSLRKTDEAWLVIDRDMWSETQLSELYRWSQRQTNYGLALSNPKFEFWLLLHFEDGNGIATPRECSTRLEKYLPNYQKAININNITVERIDNAIKRAIKKDKPPCVDWPRNPGTTVYRLVEKIIKEL